MRWSIPEEKVAFRHAPHLYTMVSFSCEACGDILKKPKLDQHAGRCRGAYYTCIDCNTTFDGPVGNNGYRSHTSCVSEEQRYHKSVYKEPKKKGKQQQQQQQQQQNVAKSQEPTPSQAAPAPVEAAPESEESKKRSREDAEATKKDEAPVVNGSTEKAESKETGEGGEPSKKKKKKNKKNKDEKETTAGEGSAAGEETKEPEATLSLFLSSTLPSILADSVSIVALRENVLEQAKDKGFTDEKAVEKALFEGISVGGKKSKVKYEFA
ncbi:hypothetical protein JCM3766R1_000498 [Sporobolomyces carnicolor]